MSVVFCILAAFTVACAVAAMSLRNLVHCALALAGALAGFGLLYLKLGAEFIGFAQILIYVGAVAILIVFAILLTRGGEEPDLALLRASWRWAGWATAVLVFATLVSMMFGEGGWARQESMAPRSAAVAPEILQKQTTLSAPRKTEAEGAGGSVADIGQKLMADYIFPLEAAGVLLTAALIGAVVLMMREPEEKP